MNEVTVIYVRNKPMNEENVFKLPSVNVKMPLMS